MIFEEEGDGEKDEIEEKHRHAQPLVHLPAECDDGDEDEDEHPEEDEDRTRHPFALDRHRLPPEDDAEQQPREREPATIRELFSPVSAPV